jgi:hypothetical protein|tara:strand:- start:24230 stop:24817 length:588 start_codon:yes stop_codon:yes gene_type:complete
MKKTIALLFLALSSAGIHAQENNESDYLLFEGKDTTFCTITVLARSAGNVSDIEYYDVAGEKHKVDRKEIKNVKSLRVAGISMDYVPIKASKPDKYKRHIEIELNGKIIVYNHTRIIAGIDQNGDRQLYQVVGAGAAIHMIKLPDGNYYDYKESDIKKYVAPYMLKFKPFADSFKEPISMRNIEAAILKYNELGE